jgi:hypothetical protein
MDRQKLRMLAALAREAWDDRLSRPCLILGVISVWLMVTLVDASFLPLLVASAWLLRWRHQRRPIVEFDDDFA